MVVSILSTDSCNGYTRMSQPGKAGLYYKWCVKIHSKYLFNQINSIIITYTTLSGVQSFFTLQPWIEGVKTTL